MKKLLLTGLLTTLAAASACDEEPSDAIQLAVVSATLTPAAPIQVVDSVVLTVTTINLSDQPIEFSTTRFLSFDMVVGVPDQGTTWRLLDGAFAAGPASPFTIEPGQSETWTATWPLIDSQGNRVLVGVYSITGVIGSDLNDPILETDPLIVGVAAPSA